MEKKELIEQIAREIQGQNGKMFYVGGVVRDFILKKESQDVDVEVYGLNAQQLLAILKQFGHPLVVGRSFSVFTLAGVTGFDIALARTERKIGKKHTSFEIDCNPTLTTKQASKRRDFTMNALLMDCLTHEIVDHWKGIEDITNKVIRHIDDATFKEDGLRVLRAARFSATYNFVIHDTTIACCKEMDITCLSKERVREELKKALLYGKVPSLFFINLEKMEQSTFWFKEIHECKEEKSKWESIINRIDHASRVIHQSTIHRPVEYMLASMCYDLYSYPKQDLKIKTLIERIFGRGKTVNVILEFIETDYYLSQAIMEGKPRPILRKIIDSCKNKEDVIRFVQMNHDNIKETCKEVLEEFLLFSQKEQITGYDLLQMNIPQGKVMKEYLDWAKELRYDDQYNKEKILEMIKKRWQNERE